jgi:ribosomal protein S18 acetylase RimI-like enzyme
MPALRLALPGDAPSLAILAERTFREAFGARNSPENMDLHCAQCFGPDIQLREIGERGLVTTLADEAGRLVGFTQLRLMRPSPAVTARKPAELSRIYVTAEWQGRGVAHALMDRTLADATRGGCDRLWLGVWEHNPKAMAFYRKFGFEIVGTQAFMLGQERQRDLIMAVDARTPG